MLAGEETHRKGSLLSRLDSFIRRLSAQRSCLNRSFEMIKNLDGPVIELGLGNGRTFDHLRVNLPDRRIVVFERQPNAHPTCTPASEDLVIGSLQATLPLAMERLGEPAALLHSDIGCGVAEIDRAIANLISACLPDLVKDGGIVLSDQRLECEGFTVIPLPSEVADGRYTFLQKSRKDKARPLCDKNDAVYK